MPRALSNTQWFSFVPFSSSSAHVEEVFVTAEAREGDLKAVVRELIKDMEP